MAIGKPATPIDFQAIDGRPVNIIWMLTSPPDKTGPHIHALARISRLMTIDKFRRASPARRRRRKSSTSSCSRRIAARSINAGLAIIIIVILRRYDLPALALATVATRV